MPNCNLCGESVPDEIHHMMAHTKVHQDPMLVMADNLLQLAPHNVVASLLKGGPFMGNPLIPGPL